MTLSTIKFTYQDKIDNVNARIKRYSEIIEDYDVRIKRAEKEDNPNISSVINSREQYEHKIKNMECVKEYYQEFVDTADYLLQNFNKEESFQLLSKNEQLAHENEVLKEEKKRLEALLDESKRDVEIQKMLREHEEDKAKALNEASKLRIKKVKDENKSLKKLKKDHKKLSAENQLLLDNNDFLEKKVQQLEDYCNHLLNRREVSPVSDSNIFKQLVGGK